MKTPRKILIEEHGKADARLEQIQKQAIASALNKGVAAERREEASAGVLRLIWGQIVMPARSVWAGFGLAWLVIIAFNLVTADGAPKMAKAQSSTQIEMIAWRERQNAVFELSSAPRTEPADRNRGAFHEPRSEREATNLIG